MLNHSHSISGEFHFFLLYRSGMKVCFDLKKKKNLVGVSPKERHLRLQHQCNRNNGDLQNFISKYYFACKKFFLTMKHVDSKIIKCLLEYFSYLNLFSPFFIICFLYSLQNFYILGQYFRQKHQKLLEKISMLEISRHFNRRIKIKML